MKKKCLKKSVSKQLNTQLYKLSLPQKLVTKINQKVIILMGFWMACMYLQNQEENKSSFQEQFSIKQAFLITYCKSNKIKISHFLPIKFGFIKTGRKILFEQNNKTCIKKKVALLIARARSFSVFFLQMSIEQQKNIQI